MTLAYLGLIDNNIVDIDIALPQYLLEIIWCEPSQCRIYATMATAPVAVCIKPVHVDIITLSVEEPNAMSSRRESVELQGLMLT